MTEQQTVYIITSGSYSDYRIDRVYLDRDEAYAHVEAYNATEPDEWRQVEEVVTGPPATRVEGPGFRAQWKAAIKDDRYIKDTPEKFSIEPHWLSEETRINARIEYRNESYVTVLGFSREHVEKVLYDTVAQVKAEKEGLA